MNDGKHQLYDCNSCLFRTLSCHFVPEEEFELIRRTSVQLTFEKGETIIKQGAKSQQLVFLHKGIVKFVYQAEVGRNFIMTIVKGPILLGGANLFFKETNIFSLVAVEDCELCFIDSRALRNVAANNGTYTLALCEQSVQDILIYLWENVYMNSPYEFTLQRKEIAEYAACSSENVITTLSKFNKEGIITLEGRKIIINDIKRLHLISKTG
jgi:CRP/FNR family transcriptional regulator, polysaccharide utilization system transcription regulator